MNEITHQHRMILHAKKPPICIMPRRLWEEMRFNELEEVIQRYIDSVEELPKEWLEEFYELYQKQKARKENE